MESIKAGYDHPSSRYEHSRQYCFNLEFEVWYLRFKNV